MVNSKADIKCIHVCLMIALLKQRIILKQIAYAKGYIIIRSEHFDSEAAARREVTVWGVIRACFAQKKLVISPRHQLCKQNLDQEATQRSSCERNLRRWNGSNWSGGEHNVGKGVNPLK